MYLPVGIYSTRSSRTEQDWTMYTRRIQILKWPSAITSFLRMHFSKIFSTGKTCYKSNGLSCDIVYTREVFTFFRRLPNFLHITWSISISNRKCSVFEFPTEQIVQSLISLEVPRYTYSFLQYLLYLFRSLWSFIQPEKHGGKNTNLTPYPSQVHNNVWSSFVQYHWGPYVFWCLKSRL